MPMGAYVSVLTSACGMAAQDFNSDALMITMLPKGYSASDTRYQAIPPQSGAQYVPQWTQ